MLSKFAEKASKQKIKPVAVVVPHAGWVYSGATAMHSFLALKNSATENPCFVIFSPNHTGYGAPCALSKQDWLTPLGEAENNVELGEAIAKATPLIGDSEEAHAQEHSIEVQLPFLQFLFKKFSFVPITLMDQRRETAEALGKAVANATKDKKNFFVIASSDFTHYEPAHEAREKDSRVIEAILKLDLTEYYRQLAATGATVCGYGAIAAAISFAKERSARKGVLLDFSNSGDESGDYGAVVDYAAIAFV
jgi:AmmeMemoRadiSam system protein B